MNRNIEGRLSCRDFLDAYTEYRDGFLDPGQTARMAAHLDACTSCDRYDRVLREGVQILRELEVEPLDRLPVGVVERYALDQGDVETRAPESGGSGFVVTAAALAAALILVVGGSPKFFGDPVPELEIAPIVAGAPMAAPAVQRGYFPLPATLPYVVAPEDFQALSRSLLHQYGGPRPARVIAAASPQLD